MEHHALRDVDDELGRIESCWNDVTTVDAKYLANRKFAPCLHAVFAREYRGIHSESRTDASHCVAMAHDVIGDVAHELQHTKNS
jgi:hypothetical protein